MKKNIGSLLPLLRRSASVSILFIIIPMSLTLTTSCGLLQHPLTVGVIATIVVEAVKPVLTRYFEGKVERNNSSANEITISRNVTIEDDTGKEHDVFPANHAFLEGKPETTVIRIKGKQKKVTVTVTRVDNELPDLGETGSKPVNRDTSVPDTKVQASVQTKPELTAQDVVENSTLTEDDTASSPARSSRNDRKEEAAPVVSYRLTGYKISVVKDGYHGQPKWMFKFRDGDTGSVLGQTGCYKYDDDDEYNLESDFFLKGLDGQPKTLIVEGFKDCRELKIEHQVFLPLSTGIQTIEATAPNKDKGWFMLRFDCAAVR